MKSATSCKTVQSELTQPLPSLSKIQHTGTVTPGRLVTFRSLQEWLQNRLVLRETLALPQTGHASNDHARMQ